MSERVLEGVRGVDEARNDPILPQTQRPAALVEPSHELLAVHQSGEGQARTSFASLVRTAASQAPGA